MKSSRSVDHSFVELNVMEIDNRTISAHCQILDRYRLPIGNLSFILKLNQSLYLA